MVTDALRGRGGRVRFVRSPALRATALASSGVRGRGRPLVGAPSSRDRRPGLSGPRRAAAPLPVPSSATLTQVNAADWQTTVYLDTAALAPGRARGQQVQPGDRHAGQRHRGAAPGYPDGLACGAAAAHPVTEVKLSFTPALSAVPQSATLVVTPPQALLAAGDMPAQVPLTVRRIVSPWQYVGIPALCGGGLALLLVALLLVIGVPAGKQKRVHWGAELLRTPLFAGRPGRSATAGRPASPR